MRMQLLLLSALLVSQYAVAAADAQQPPQTQQPKQQIPPGRRLPPRTNYVRNKSEFNFESLKQSPDLPDLPQPFGNVKFISGSMSPHAQGGSSYTLVYDCKEQPQRMFDFYLQQLSQGKWVIGQNTPGKTLTARKGKNSVVIQTSSRSRENSVCDLIILYKLGS